MIFRFTTAGTPAWKLGLIPVLATVLFKVARPSNSEVELPESPAAAETQAALQNPAMRPTTVLPELTLDDALKFDPFGSLPMPERALVEPPPMLEEAPVVETAPEPAQPAAPQVNPLVSKAATLKQLKVSAVFPSPKGSVAIIDSKTVRVGDLLSPGVRVVEIRGTSVILRVEDGETGPRAESSDTGLR
jgi:hypothetical protein